MGDKGRRCLIVNRIRVGLVGTGRMAANMVRAVSFVRECQLQAVGSDDPDRARAFAKTAGIPHSCEDSHSLVCRPDVDAVYVAGRTASHFAVARMALEAGKPTLVEKPLTATLAQCRALVAVARTNNTLLVENLWCFALPAYRLLEAELASGEYGIPRHLNFAFGIPVSDTAYPSLFSVADSGVIRDRGVYGIALAIRLLGTVVDVSAEVIRNDAGVDTTAFLRLHHDSGAIADIAVSFDLLMSNRAAVSLTRGVLQLEPPLLACESLAGQRTPPDDGWTDSVPRNTLKNRLKAIPLARRINQLQGRLAARSLSYGPDPYAPNLRHFCQLVRDDRKESELSPLALSEQVHEVIGRLLLDGPRV